MVKILKNQTLRNFCKQVIVKQNNAKFFAVKCFLIKCSVLLTCLKIILCRTIKLHLLLTCLHLQGLRNLICLTY